MTCPTTLYWIRHGPTRTRKICGWTDVDCDLSMHATLARLDAHLPEDALVISSDLKRARRTADIFSVTRERLPDSPDLRELNFGYWEGLTTEEISAQDEVRARTFWENPFRAHPPGGERWATLTRRVAGAIKDLIAAHPGRPLVAVAHFGVIMSHYMHVRQGSGGAESWLYVDTLSLSRFVHNSQGWHVLSFNECFDDQTD